MPVGNANMPMPRIAITLAHSSPTSVSSYMSPQPTVASPSNDRITNRGIDKHCP